MAEVVDELEFLRERARQLEEALQSRIVIEQAKGMLAARRAPRSNRIKIHDLAHRVTGEAMTPAEIARYLDSRAS